MRWSGWILAAMVVGYAGVASGGQPGCVGCGGRSAAWLALSGEAGCSPPGYVVERLGRPPLLLCESTALLQQRLGRLLRTSRKSSGVLGPSRRSEMPLLSRGHATDADEGLYGLPREIRQSSRSGFASVHAKMDSPSPPVVQPTPSLAPIPAPSNEAPKSPLPTNSRFRPACGRRLRFPQVPASPSSAPSVAPNSALAREAPMPPDEAFREVGQSWLR